MRQLDKDQIRKIDITIDSLEEQLEEALTIEAVSGQKILKKSKLIEVDLNTQQVKRAKIVQRYRIAYSKYISFIDELREREAEYDKAAAELKALASKRESKLKNMSDQSIIGITISKEDKEDFDIYSRAIKAQEKKVQKLKQLVIRWQNKVSKHPGTPDCGDSKIKKVEEIKELPPERTHAEIIAEVLKRLNVSTTASTKVEVPANPFICAAVTRIPEALLNAPRHENDTIEQNSNSIKDFLPIKDEVEIKSLIFDLDTGKLIVKE